MKRTKIIRTLTVLPVILMFMSFTVNDRETDVCINENPVVKTGNMIMDNVRSRKSMHTYVNSGDNIRVADYLGNRRCAISYTFDDGLKEHFTVVYPVLKRLGLKATFCIMGKATDAKIYVGKPRMTWKELRTMQRDGQEISSHGWSHLNLKGKTSAQVRRELWLNDSAFIKHFGHKALTVCYPGNSIDSQAVAIASEGRVTTRLYQLPVGEEVNKITTEKLDLWLRNLLISGKWGITMTHGINTGYDRFFNPDILWNHLRKVSTMQDSVWVGTLAEVGAYVAERRNTRLTVARNGKTCTVTPHLKLDKTIFKQPLTMVVNDGRQVKSVRQAGKRLKTELKGNDCLFDFNPYNGDIEIIYK